MSVRARAAFAAVCVWYAAALPAFAQDWKEEGSDHFIVRYLQDEKFAKEVAEKAERYYGMIASDLGYPRYSNFWTWDNRVKIYIYPDRASFLKATNQPQWSEGMADYSTKTILSYAWSQGFTDSLLPHEMAHLIFRDFVGFKGEIPLWLDEGVAQWAEEAKRTQVKAIARHLFENDSLLSLEDMMKLDVRRLPANQKVFIRSTNTREGKPGVLFLSGENLVNAYYIQSVSLVGFLIERFGSLGFAEFCRNLRDGKSVEDALRSAYPDHITTLEEFEKKWRDYVAHN